MLHKPTFAMALALSVLPQAQAQQSRDLPLVIALDAADCRRLVAGRDAANIQHQPAPDVNYRPGRDVDSQGRPIAPADLPWINPMPLTGPIELPLTMTLDSLLGSRTPRGLGESELGIARIAIDPMSGRLAFNGQPLEQPAEDAVTSACREYLAGLPGPR